MFEKLLTPHSSIALNRRLRNVSELIMISRHLEKYSKSVTKSLANESKSACKLWAIENLWLDETKHYLTLNPNLPNS